MTPLVYLGEDGRTFIFASKGGAPNHPGWFHNLKANPDVAMEIGSDKLDVVATEVTGDERDRIYKVQKQQQPQFAEYEANTDRTIPVVELKPR